MNEENHAKSPSSLFTLDTSMPAQDNTNIQNTYLYIQTLFTMSEPSEPSKPSKCITCPDNATAHPGLVDIVKKQFHNNNVKGKKHIWEEKKRVKKQREKDAVHKLTEVEKHVTEDAVDSMLKPQGAHNKSCQLCCTKAYLEISLTESPDSDDIDGGAMRHSQGDGVYMANMTDEEAPRRKNLSQGSETRSRSILMMKIIGHSRGMGMIWRLSELRRAVTTMRT